MKTEVTDEQHEIAELDQVADAFSEFEIARLRDLEARVQEGARKINEERLLREAAEGRAKTEEKRARILETLEAVGAPASQDALVLLDRELRWNDQCQDYTTETGSSLREGVEMFFRAHPHLGVTRKVQLDQQAVEPSTSRSRLDLDQITPGMDPEIRQSFWKEISRLFSEHLQEAKV